MYYLVLQIYSEYAKATEELASEREEKTKLNQYLDQILQVQLSLFHFYHPAYVGKSAWEDR